MNFADELRKHGNYTQTENGALALKSTNNVCLDLFATIGSLRSADESRICNLFELAFEEDKLLAMKIVFYARDIRGGLGERKVFRVLINYMADTHPNELLKNIHLFGEYGRYDDLYELVGTLLEEHMWNCMKVRFEMDLDAMDRNLPVSLLAKWIKTADASSPQTRKLGILTAKKLGYSVYEFKRLVRKLRKYIDVTESLMSTGKWSEIDYSKVSSRAMLNYRNAFKKNDEKRFSEFIDRAVNGDEKINSSTLYPYDIVEKILYNGEKSNVLEAQWNQLPNYVDENTNAIVMCDVSGSMYGRPMATSIGLGIYFAERNKGAYHNMFMTFSNKPTSELLKGENLYQKIQNLSNADWGMSTNLKSAFEKILEVAISGNVEPNEMPKSLIIVSDMEIDSCCDNRWTFYDAMSKLYESHGYVIPNIIFWNVNSRNNTFHVDSNRKGVQMFSGQSASTFKQLIACVGLTPVQAMEKVLNSERYDLISI